jgi:hypothetical protein
MNEYLLIPFDKKDEIKKDHPIKWDVAKKLWYFDTITPYYSKENTEPRNGLPQELERYRIHSLSTEQVPYDEKDFVKKEFKSLVWNPLTTSWSMSEKDYKIFLKKT